MITWAKFFSGLWSLFSAFVGVQQREQAKADGAAIQRAHDLEVENERIAKADRAADAVRNSGGVSVDEDPLNIRNRRKRK